MTDKTMTLEQIGAVIQGAWENHDDEGRVILTMKNAQDITESIRHLSQPAERGEAVAWAWKSDGMTGWALGHCKPTPDNTHEFHERNTVVRPLVFGDTAPPPAAGVPDGMVLVPKRFLDNVRAASQPFTHPRAVPVLLEEAMAMLSATPSPAIDVAAVREVIEKLRILPLNRKVMGISDLDIAKELARAIGDAK